MGLIRTVLEWLLRLSAGVALLALSLIILDIASGILIPRDTSTSVYIADNSVNRKKAFVFLPGFQAQGKWLAKALESYLQAHGLVMGVNPPEQGYDVEALYQTSVTALGKYPDLREVVLIGPSGGAQALYHWARRNAQAASPYRLRLVFYTGLSQASRIRQPALLLWISSHYPGGWLSTLAWAGATKWQQRQAPKPDDNASPQLIRQVYHSNVWAGAPAIFAQIRSYVRFSPPQPGELANRPEILSVTYLQSQHEDPAVETQGSISDFQAAFGDKLKVVEVPGLNPGDHVPIVEKPSGFTVQLLKQLSLPTG